MTSTLTRLISRTTLTAAAILVAAAVRAVGAPPILLSVDAREAPQNILHVSETIPISGSGPFTLYYPKWIPGEHGPTGPIESMAAMRIQARGMDVPWERDLVDLYAFHVTPPRGATELRVTFDQLMTSSDPMSTPNLLIVNWNRVLVYPAGVKADALSVSPSITLPAGWSFGTALDGPKQSGDRVDFATTPLTTLVDSPLDAGRYGRKITLLDSGGFTNEIDAFADAPTDLALNEEGVQHYKNLVAETDALYRARHWTHYHFLLTLSDVIPPQGIEHHQSSDNRAPADYWTDPSSLEEGADLLPHEFSHSWNGKYRRPADLITPDYQVPEKTDLLWVYEGLNQYLGDMLVFRTGMIAPSMYPEYLSRVYARMDEEPGRLADPLVDTAVAAPYLYLAPDEWSSQRRSAGDFYDEGELVWLGVDAIIRTRSHGARSLDDFLKAFDGQRNTPPMVVGYTRAQVEDALNSVQQYDWHAYFEKWVYEVAPHPVADGIDLTGWKLAWSETPNHFDDLRSSTRHTGVFLYSLGFDTDESGKIDDVRAGSPAATAGIGTTTQVIAVNGRKFSAELLHQALKDGKSSTRPLSLLLLTGDLYRTVEIDYHGGDRFPHLERVTGSEDLLAKIMASHRTP